MVFKIPENVFEIHIINFEDKTIPSNRSPSLPTVLYSETQASPSTIHVQGG